jgi:hypothetical protein
LDRLASEPGSLGPAGDGELEQQGGERLQSIFHGDPHLGARGLCARDGVGPRPGSAGLLPEGDSRRGGREHRAGGEQQQAAVALHLAGGDGDKPCGHRRSNGQR